MYKPCKKNKVRNPATGRCVKKNSPVLKKGPVSPVGPIGPVGPVPLVKQFYKKIPQNIVKKVDINKPNQDTDVKVLVPSDPNNVIKLVHCGKGMIRNPATGRCVKLSGPVGKRLTSVPYVIVNPPSTPQKGPYFVPQGPKPPQQPKGKPKLQVPYVPLPNQKKESIQTALDTNSDGYVSIKEYMDSVESLGPLEKSSGQNFAFYNQRDLGIVFILTLIKKMKGPIHHIGCIPLYKLCTYKTARGNFYNMTNIMIKNKNKIDLRCPDNQDYYHGNYVSYATIVVLNAPERNGSSNKPIKILTPPNLKEVIEQCEKDNKYMIVCDLTLLFGTDFKETSHANVLIFDTRRKTIERFDPHGDNKYKDVKLVYDPNSGNYDPIGRKDFKFGIVDPNLRESGALFDQVKIDNELFIEFNKHLPNYTYYGTNQTTPYLGPQIKADEFGGLCVTWSCMYMILRLLNPDLSPPEITMNMINGTPEQLKNRILRFQKFIIKTLQSEKENIFKQ